MVWRGEQSGSRRPMFGERSDGASGTPGLGRGQGLIGVGLVVALVAVLAGFAATGQATPARHPVIFGGSIVLDDHRPLVVADLATGQATIRLQDVFAQVDANSYADVQSVPVDGGTMLVNRVSGTFNALGQDNFAVKRTGGGVGLGALPGTTGAVGVASGSSVWIVRRAPSATVSLVGRDTVEAAAADVGPAGTEPSVAPRGFASLGGTVSDRAGTQVVAAGDLWVVADVGGDRVVQLHPDTTAHDGLAVIQRGAVPAPGPAVLESVPTRPGRAVIGLATPGSVRLWSSVGRTAPRDVATPATAGATTLLPVSSTSGVLWFLAGGRGGWSLVGVTPAGLPAGSHRLAGLPGGATLVAPVESAGSVWTMDEPAEDTQPTLWRIGAAAGMVQAVPGAPRYPLKTPAERAVFTSAEVVVDGPRVIFDNPDSLLAVMVFTDGTHGPVVIDKSAAVDESALGPTALDPTGGARHQPTPTPPNPAQAPPTTVPAQAPAPQVSQQVTCANTTQTPRAPQISGLAPTAHSVLVSWTYPLLDAQDCEPTTWTVTVQALNGRPPNQPIETISGQQQLQFTGLHPSSTYRVVVTAYIRNQSTASPPATVTTPPAGPDAPTSVVTTAGDNGIWTVSWQPCISAACDVPAATWIITGTGCGGGYTGTPPRLTVDGTQTSTTIDAASLGVLGSSLSFSVQGLTDSGLAGDPRSDGTCTEAWQPPDASAITVSGSAVAAGTSLTGTVTVAPDGDPLAAWGSASPSFVFHLGGRSSGPTTATSATFPGLTPGTSLTPSVTVIPRDHPSAQVTVAGTPFTQTLQWPALSLNASFAPAPDNPNKGIVSVAMADAPIGVPFTMTGTLTCSSYSQQFSGPFTEGGAPLTTALDLVTIGGPCHVTAQLAEASTHLYGTPSPQQSANVPGVAAPPLALPDPKSFSVQDGSPGPNYTVTVNGNTGGIGGNWTLTPGVGICPLGAPSPASGPADAPIQLPETFTVPITCTVKTVDVTYTYLGQTNSFMLTNTGAPTSTTSSTSIPHSSTTKPKGGGSSASPNTELAASSASIGGSGSAGGEAVIDGILAAVLGGSVVAGLGRWRRRPGRGRRRPARTDPRSSR